MERQRYPTNQSGSGKKTSKKDETADQDSQKNTRSSVSSHNVSLYNLSDYFPKSSGSKSFKSATPKCNQCNKIMKQVVELLHELRNLKIEPDQMTCPLCCYYGISRSCKKCYDNINKWLKSAFTDSSNRSDQYPHWALKVKKVLTNILNSQLQCPHSSVKPYDDELERLIDMLRKPFKPPSPHIMDVQDFLSTEAFHTDDTNSMLEKELRKMSLFQNSDKKENEFQQELRETIERFLRNDPHFQNLTKSEKKRKIEEIIAKNAMFMKSQREGGDGITDGIRYKNAREIIKTNDIAAGIEHEDARKILKLTDKQGEVAAGRGGKYKEKKDKDREKENKDANIKVRYKEKNKRSTEKLDKDKERRDNEKQKNTSKMDKDTDKKVEKTKKGYKTREKDTEKKYKETRNEKKDIKTMDKEGGKKDKDIGKGDKDTRGTGNDEYIQQKDTVKSEKDTKTMDKDEGEKDKEKRITYTENNANDIGKGNKEDRTTKKVNDPLRKSAQYDIREIETEKKERIHTINGNQIKLSDTQQLLREYWMQKRTSKTLPDKASSKRQSETWRNKLELKKSQPEKHKKSLQDKHGPLIGLSFSDISTDSEQFSKDPKGNRLYDHVSCMIKGNKIVPLKKRKIHEEIPKPDNKLKYTPGAESLPGPQKFSVAKSQPRKINANSANKVESEYFTYQLSDPKFITNGITKLPTKELRKLFYVFRMRPTLHSWNWFERHKNYGVMYYDTGEKMAEVDQTGCGRLFYRNGVMALNYYKSDEEVLGYRCVIYDSANKDKNGRKTLHSILASFDTLGNGVVYDHNGNTRLEYNQTEGQLFDKEIAPPHRWKWHHMNENPTITESYLEEHVDLTYFFNSAKRQSIQPTKEKKLSSNLESTEEKKLVDSRPIVELEKLIKEQEKKISLKYKPAHPPTITFKLNEEFAFHMVNQANVYLMFRDKLVSIKMDLGLILDNKNIVKMEMTHLSKITTPYDDYYISHETDSLVHIKKVVANTKRYMSE